MYGTKYKGVRYLEMAEGYVTRMALDADDQVIELYGIPTEAGVSVQVHEKNDTYDAYSLTATVANSSVTDISAVNKILTANQDSIDTVAVPVDQDTKTAITFTNDLTEISPTGTVRALSACQPSRMSPQSRERMLPPRRICPSDGMPWMTQLSTDVHSEAGKPSYPRKDGTAP